jgi:hypothetical protein
VKYKEGDIVLVSSHAGVDVRARLEKRWEKPKKGWGAAGWDATIIYKKDVDNLRQNGVPYKSGEKPLVWVFDHQIIKLVRSKNARSKRR